MFNEILVYIGCVKGYTSDMGENCKPCSKNTYGERCRFDCSCTRNQMYVNKGTSSRPLFKSHNSINQKIIQGNKLYPM